MRKFFIIILCILSGGLYSTAVAQQSNLQKIYSSIENSLDNNIKTNNKENLFLNYSSPPNYKLLKNRILLWLAENDTVVMKKKEADEIINYSLDEAGVKYLDVFRNGLFGSYKVKRKIYLNGSLNIVRNNKIVFAKKIKLTDIDTVNYDKVKSLENFSLPFTQSKLPAAPFISGIIEPAVAIGTAVITVYLFFKIRSK
jgi:hypothetical protein